MTGKYEIEVYNNRIHYYLTVKRNITVVQGDSASGKTELLRLISEYEENGNSSGITVKSQKKCTVLTNVDWELRLSALKQSIIFIDETAIFIKSQRFAELVKGSDNYFVLINRDALEQLPYSIEEIYGLRNVSSTSKYKEYKKVYNEMYRLYNLSAVNKQFNPEIVFTEDSNSGFECFSLIFDCDCKAVGGKSRIYNAVKDYEGKDALVIVDGAAFGSNIGKVMRYLSVSKKSCVLYAPESFEYLLLKAGIIDVPVKVLEKTYEYADSTKFLSWEEFYTDYLVDASKDGVYRYTKSHLGKAYKNPKVIERIKEVMPKQIVS